MVAGFGEGRSTGTQPFQLAGNIARGGLLEAAFGVTLNDLVEDLGGGTISEWVATHTRPGDIVVLPFVGTALRSVAHQIYDSGRSVLAVSHNPESQSALNGSTMSLPIGGTINPG